MAVQLKHKESVWLATGCAAEGINPFRLKTGHLGYTYTHVEYQKETGPKPSRTEVLEVGTPTPQRSQ